MGSAAHAILVTKQNRALQRTGNKSFLSKSHKTRTYSTSKIPLYKNSNLRYSEVQVVPLRTKLQLAGYAICFVGMTIYMISSQQKIQITSEINSPEVVEESKVLTEAEIINRLYFKYLKRGDRYFKKGKIVLAYQDYKVALRLIPTGRKANFGMAYSLAELCGKYQLYCDEAASYAVAMRSWQQGNKAIAQH